MRMGLKVRIKRPPSITRMKHVADILAERIKG